jgi:hypothetical protein
MYFRWRGGNWRLRWRGWFVGLDQARRTEHRRRRLGWLDLFRRSRLLAAAFRRRVRFGEHVAGRKRDVALSREPFDEGASHDLLEGARRALQLDPMIALEQCQDFLARRPEQLGDLVNPHRCQIKSSLR